jgi:hypothetical protein
LALETISARNIDTAFDVEKFETDKEFIIFYRNLKEELGMK